MEPNQTARGSSSSEREARAAQSRSPCSKKESASSSFTTLTSRESPVATLLDLLSDLGQARVSAGPPDPTGFDLVCNASPLGMEDDDPLPVDAALLNSSMFVGDVIAGHGVTPFLQAAQAAGGETASGDHMVEAAQDLMVDFMLQEGDTSSKDA